MNLTKFFQTSVLVRDLRTELIIQPFADRTLVLVTQMGKVGHLIQASIPSMADISTSNVSDPHGPLPSPPSAIQLIPMFGSAPSTHMQTVYSLYTAQIATLIWQATRGNHRNVVVGIALQNAKGHEEGTFSEEEQQSFHAVMECLRKVLR